ncbi:MULTISPECIES: hypothetical protein [Sphingobacterium]|nr:MULTISPECIES: hypothetical protein [unclassified Sphingobacterium]
MKDYRTHKISYHNFYEFKNFAKYKGGNKLMVGTYDPAKVMGLKVN